MKSWLHWPGGEDQITKLESKIAGLSWQLKLLNVVYFFVMHCTLKQKLWLYIFAPTTFKIRHYF